MTPRIWPPVATAFLFLLLLIPVFAFSTWRKSTEIDRRTRAAQATYRKANEAINGIRNDIYRVEMILPDRSQPALAETQIDLINASIGQHLETLAGLVQEERYSDLSNIRQGLNRLLELARHNELNSVAMLRLVNRIDALNEAYLSFEEREIRLDQERLLKSAGSGLGLVLLLGIAIAIASTLYLRKLENVSLAEMKRAENAERELRRLSHQLVRIQEEERKTISRELHDEIGQMLTGLRMELAGLSLKLDETAFRERLESLKKLAEESLRSIRNLALLLRPSMLDDLGLDAALRWHAKEFSRRTGTAVQVEISGQLSDLPEDLRICLYRAVQEALTNCAKYAQASRISVSVEREEESVRATIQDNGQGFDAAHGQRKGLGLMGMSERVRALRGDLSVASQPGKGTIVKLSLPIDAVEIVEDAG